MSYCFDCKAGQYQSQPNRTECINCEAGRYNQKSGLADCVTCPVGKFQSVGGLTYCATCTLGTYLVVPVGTSPENATRLDGISNCKACPAGTSCLNGKVNALPNYYIQLNPEDNTLSTYLCPQDYCQDCTSGAQSPILSLNGPVSTCCSANRLPPDQNPLCAKCQSDYVEFAGECVHCPQTNSQLLAAQIILQFLMVYAIHLFAQTRSPLLKIFFYYVQLVVLFFGDNTNFVNWLNIFQFKVTNAFYNLCVINYTVPAKLFSSIITPIIAFGQLIVIGLLDWLVIKLTNRSITRGNRDLDGLPDSGFAFNVGKETHGFAWSAYMRSFIALLLFTYQAITFTALTFLNCTTVGQVEVVSAYPAFQCDSSEYNQIKPVFVICLILFTIGVPLYLASFFIFRRNSMSDQTFFARYGFIWESYRSKYLWWELVYMARRLILIVVYVSTYSKSRAYQYSWLSFCSVILLLMHMLCNPFQGVLMNQLESFSLLLHSLMVALLIGSTVPFGDGPVAGYVILIYIPVAAAAAFYLFTHSNYGRKRFGAWISVELGMEEDRQRVEADMRRNEINERIAQEDALQNKIRDTGVISADEIELDKHLSKKQRKRKEAKKAALGIHAQIPVGLSSNQQQESSELQETSSNSSNYPISPSAQSQFAGSGYGLAHSGPAVTKPSTIPARESFDQAEGYAPNNNNNTSSNTGAYLTSPSNASRSTSASSKGHGGIKPVLDPVTGKVSRWE
jgi:hypothetical protein